MTMAFDRLRAALLCSLLLTGNAHVAYAQEDPNAPVFEDPTFTDPSAPDPDADDPNATDPDGSSAGGETDDTPSVIQPPEMKTEPKRVSNPVAEFAGLDKITGRIITFDVYINETVQFGALQVTPKVCYSRPDAEEPKTDTFVDVDEITLDRKIRRIFTGWMFAESPGLNAVEHPVYDVWLKSCKQKSDVPPPTQAKSN